jgi:hypothetical protein
MLEIDEVLQDFVEDQGKPKEYIEKTKAND